MALWNKIDRAEVWAVLAVAWMGLIYVLSDRPGGDYESLKGATSWLPAATFFAHTGLYAVLSVFVMRFLFSLGRLPVALNYYLTLFVALAYGMLDELHQSNVEDRASEGGDVVADVFGAVIVVVLWFVLKRIKDERGERLDVYKGR